MKWTNGAESMSSDISNFAKSAGIDTKYKPEEILTTVMHAIMDDTGAKAWSNQEMEEWAVKPNWQTGTAESLPATEAYSRMLTKIELHKLLSKTYKFGKCTPSIVVEDGGVTSNSDGRVDSKRTSALSTLAVDAAIKSGSLQTGLEGVMKMLKEKPDWMPDPTDKEFSWMPSPSRLHQARPGQVLRLRLPSRLRQRLQQQLPQRLQRRSRHQRRPCLLRPPQRQAFPQQLPQPRARSGAELTMGRRGPSVPVVQSS